MSSTLPKTVAGLGELLWDVFSDGRRLGGAPANVAYHVCALGDRGVLLSRVGTDPLGDEALEVLAARGVDVDAVQRDPARPTGTAEVRVAGGEADFVIRTDVAWTVPSFTEAWRQRCAGLDALCFGTLFAAQPAGGAVLEAAVAALPAASLRLLDLNLRAPHDTDDAIRRALACANAVKLSEAEAERLAAMLGSGADIEALAAALRRRYDVQTLAVTRGAAGCSLVTAAGVASRPGLSVAAGGDPVGAGDAFTAALAHHLLRGTPLEATATAANTYAAFVAGASGAMPEVPAAIRQRVGRGV